MTCGPTVPRGTHLIPSPLPQIEPPSRPDSCRAPPAPIPIAPSAPVMSLRPRPHPPPALLLISSRATAFGHAMTSAPPLPHPLLRLRQRPHPLPPTLATTSPPLPPHAVHPPPPIPLPPPHVPLFDGNPVLSPAHLRCCRSRFHNSRRTCDMGSLDDHGSCSWHAHGPCSPAVMAPAPGALASWAHPTVVSPGAWLLVFCIFTRLGYSTLTATTTACSRCSTRASRRASSMPRCGAYLLWSTPPVSY
jgi:hypothetical protein